MHTKAIALLSAALVLAACLTACEKHSKYGKLYVDARGMEHVLVTDKNGETVVDAAGNLIEVMTDGDGKPVPAVTANGTTSPLQHGEYQTNSVTFPGVIVSQDKIEDQYSSVEIPDGWTAFDAGSSYIVEHLATGARVTIRPNAARTSVAAIESIQEDCETAGVDYETDQTELDGLRARVIRYAALNTAFTAYAVNNNEDFATTVLCTVDSDKVDQVSFDEVLHNIRFK